MKTDSIAKRRSDRTWMTAESCKLDDFVDRPSPREISSAQLLAKRG